LNVNEEKDEGVIDPAVISKEQWIVAHRFVSSFTVDLNHLMIKIANASSKELLDYREYFDSSDFNHLFSESINRNP
jgi:hypothetical protein